MPRLPVVSAKELIKFLGRQGFAQTGQKGSHIKLKHPDERVAIVPNHKEIKPGTLKKGILNPLGIEVEKLIAFLKE